MQWVLQQFEDTQKLANALERQGIAYSWHKVVPFIGDLQPAPEIVDRNRVVLFGSYTLWRYAQSNSLTPGVFKIRPFVKETPWHPFLLNGADALFCTLGALPEHLSAPERAWFMRPIEDSKEVAGSVKTEAELLALAAQVAQVDPDDIPKGSLRSDTELMLTPPRPIQKEWRFWVVAEKVVTYSLYKEGSRVVYREEVDADALAFAQTLVAANPGYAEAYVLDICRTGEGLFMLETNCINAAGFYAADLSKLVAAIEALG